VAAIAGAATAAAVAPPWPTECVASAASTPPPRPAAPAQVVARLRLAAERLRRDNLPAPGLSSRVRRDLLLEPAADSQWARVLGLLDDAAAADLQLDETTVRAGAVALAKAGRWELASWLLAGAERGRPAPSQAIAAARVEVCGRGAQWQRAMDVALGSQARGAELDAAVCGAAVSACAKAGRWVQAVALVEALCQHGLEPTSWVYEAAVYILYYIVYII